MKKFFKIAAIVLVAIIFIGTFVFLFQKSRPEETRYEILTAEQRNVERTTIVTGTIEPRDEVLIKPQISGIIAELYKQPGDQVKAGEVIAKVKVIPDMSQLSSAESRLRLARINLKQAKTDYERNKQLYDQKLISGDEYDKTRLAYNQAREEVSSATDALQIVKDGVSASNSSYSTTLIRSTITGLILDVPVKVGNSVIMSNTFNDGTTIASVANMGDLIFKGTVDETEVGRLSVGMPMKITIGALPDAHLSARLEYISPKVLTGTGSANQFEIKAALSSQGGFRIRAGYSANAELVLERAQNVIAIPEGAVEFEGEKTFVYVLKSDNPQTFERRAVTTGLSDGMYIEIKGNLKKGDKVRGNVIDNEEEGGEK